MDDSFRDCMNTNAIVSSDGHVLWMFPAVVNTYCTLDVRHFPFDEQKCELIFISWTYNGHKLNVTYNASEHQAIYYRPKVGGLLSTLSKPHTLPSKIIRYRRKRTLRTQDTLEPRHFGTGAEVTALFGTVSKRLLSINGHES